MMKLKKDSWYGKFLGHPESWCSLVWNALWRPSLVVFYSVVVAAFGWIMTVGNYYLVVHWTALNTPGAGVDAFMMNLTAAAAAFDITIAIGLIVVLAFNLYRVVPFFTWLTKSCPKVEWS